MTALIDISLIIDRDSLLEALWRRSKPALYFSQNDVTPPSFDLLKAKAELDDGYADYVCGRVIKADIYTADMVYPRSYDQYNGTGAFQSVVNSLS